MLLTLEGILTSPPFKMDFEQIVPTPDGILTNPAHFSRNTDRSHH